MLRAFFADGIIENNLKKSDTLLKGSPNETTGFLELSHTNSPEGVQEQTSLISNNKSDVFLTGKKRDLGTISPFASENDWNGRTHCIFHLNKFTNVI